MPIAARAQHARYASTAPFESGKTVRAAAPSEGWRGEGHYGPQPRPCRCVAARGGRTCAHNSISLPPAQIARGICSRSMRADHAPSRRAAPSCTTPSCNSSGDAYPPFNTPCSTAWAAAGSTRCFDRFDGAFLRTALGGAAQRIRKKSLTGTGARTHARTQRVRRIDGRRRTRPHFRDGDAPHAPFARPGQAAGRERRWQWGGTDRVAGSAAPRARRKARPHARPVLLRTLKGASARPPAYVKHHRGTH